MSSPESTEFFESMYSAAGGDDSRIPWQDAISKRLFGDWLETFDPSRHQRALVVAAGLGDEAAALAALGLGVVAFDHAPSAVNWARERHKDVTIDWQVADLLSPPAEWIGAFDLVVEVFTIQSIDPQLQVTAAEAVRSFVGAGGALLAVALVRRGDEPPGGPPWPLHHDTLESLGEGLREISVRTEELDAGLSCVMVELSRPTS